MWLINTEGFFSVVEDRDNRDVLVVRARARHDLDNLRDHYLPRLSETTLDIQGDRDYPARAWCTRTQWADAARQMAVDIDYGNFKSAVAARQGYQRSNLYHDVWDVLVNLEDLDPTPGRVGPWQPAKAS